MIEIWPFKTQKKEAEDQKELKTFVFSVEKCIHIGECGHLPDFFLFPLNADMNRVSIENIL
jgi:hypothetical protein